MKKEVSLLCLNSHNMHGLTILRIKVRNLEQCECGSEMLTKILMIITIIDWEKSNIIHWHSKVIWTWFHLISWLIDRSHCSTRTRKPFTISWWIWERKWSWRDAQGKELRLWKKLIRNAKKQFRMKFETIGLKVVSSNASSTSTKWMTWGRQVLNLSRSAVSYSK
jgi:hypothetical protein